MGTSGSNKYFPTNCSAPGFCYPNAILIPSENPNDPSTDLDMDAFISKFDLSLMVGIDESFEEGMVMGILNATVKEQDILQLLDNLETFNEVLWANPFLICEEPNLQGVTNRFYVQLKDAADFLLLVNTGITYNCSIIEQSTIHELGYYLSADKNSAGNAIELAATFHNLNQFHVAEPDFLLILEETNINDQFMGEQCALQNNGDRHGSASVSADLEISPAWNITTGSPDITETYYAYHLDKAKPELSAEEYEVYAEETAAEVELFSSPVMQAIIYFFTTFLVGLVISIIAAFVMKRKYRADVNVT